MIKVKAKISVRVKLNADKNQYVAPYEAASLVLAVSKYWT